MRLIEINLDANNDGRSVSAMSILFIMVMTLLGLWIVKKNWQKVRRVRFHCQALPIVHAPGAPAPMPAAPGLPPQEQNVLNVPRVQI